MFKVIKILVLALLLPLTANGQEEHFGKHEPNIITIYGRVAEAIIITGEILYTNHSLIKVISPPYEQVTYHVKMLDYHLEDLVKLLERNGDSNSNFGFPLRLKEGLYKCKVLTQKTIGIGYPRFDCEKKGKLKDKTESTE